VVSKEEKATKKLYDRLLDELHVEVAGMSIANIVASVAGFDKATAQAAVDFWIEAGRVESTRPNPKKATIYVYVAEPVTAEVEAAAKPRNSNGQEPLQRGKLRAMVQAALTGRPGDEMGPVEVAKFIGGTQRVISVGAVNNALAKLAEDASTGITLTQDKPRRYAYSK